MSIKNKSIKSALGSDTVNIAERIIDNIGNYISPRYLTHGDVEGYSDNEISPGDASDILEELNWKLIHIRDILEKAIDDDDITDTDELDGLRGAIDEADSFAKDTLTREAYNSLAMDIFHPIIRNFNVVRNSYRPIKSGWERTDMASGPIWDKDNWRIIEKSNFDSEDKFYVLRDKSNQRTEDKRFDTLTEAMDYVDFRGNLNSSHKIKSSYTSWDDFYKKGCELGLDSYMNSLDELHNKYGRFRDVPKEELSSILKNIPDDKYENYQFIEDMFDYFDWYDVINSSTQKGMENVAEGTQYDDYHIDTTGMGILDVEHIINEIEGRGNQAVLTVKTSDGATQHTQFNAKDWKAYKDAVNGVDEFSRNSRTKGAAITDVWVTEVEGGSYVRNSRKITSTRANELTEQEKDDLYEIEKNEAEEYYNSLDDSDKRMLRLRYGVKNAKDYVKFFIVHPNKLSDDYEFMIDPRTKLNSRQIKSSKSAIDCFPVSEEEAEDIEELRETFPDDADLRAALEDYFDIYDDYAKMSVREFDTSFKEFIGSSKKIIKSNEELKSSGIGSIKDEFCLGQINDTQAELALQMEGKSKKDAKRIIEKWKENGVVKSSIDKAISRTEEYFGTTASNNTISCNDIITEADAINIRQIADEENVDVQVGDFSVRFFEKPEIIESSLIDKYIKQVGRLVKETDEGTINDDKSSRLNDRIDNIYDKLIDEKDPDIMYDRTEGQYTIKGQDVKRYVIEQLGDNYFEKNKSWDLLFDTILPNIQDFATTKEIAACYEVYEDCGNGKLKFISNTLDKNEALVFKNNGFVIKSSKIIVNSALTAGDEVVIEIERHGKWEMVSQTNDERGWSLNGDVAIFDTKDDAKKSKLAKDLEKAGYSPNRGNMRYKKYD